MFFWSVLRRALSFENYSLRSKSVVCLPVHRKRSSWRCPCSMDRIDPLNFVFIWKLIVFTFPGTIQDHDRTIKGSSGTILCLCWYYGEYFTEIHSLLCYFHDSSSITCDGGMLLWLLICYSDSSTPLYGHQFLNHFLWCTSLASHFSSKQVLFLGWFSCKNLLEKKASGEWSARLAVAPLFETIPDLEVLFTRLWIWTFFYYVHS
jgi:hypothetical protein